MIRTTPTVMFCILKVAQCLGLQVAFTFQAVSGNYESFCNSSEVRWQ